MMHSKKILQDINTLPIEQRISIIEKLLQSVKKDVFYKAEQKLSNNIQLMYQVLMLNSENNTLHSLLNQTTNTDVPIKKGDKNLNPTELFGIWEEKQKNIEDIRKNNWQRDWSL